MTPDEHWAKAFEFALRAEQALERTVLPTQRAEFIKMIEGALTRLHRERDEGLVTDASEWNARLDILTGRLTVLKEAAAREGIVTGPPDYEKSQALSALGLLHAALGGRPE